MPQENRSQRSRLRLRLMASLAAAALTAALPARTEDAKAISLPAGSLEAALTALAAQTGDELLYGPELVAGRKAQALSGRFTADQALARLLQDSDIVASHAGPRVIVLKAKAMAARPTAAGVSPIAAPFGAEAPGSVTPPPSPPAGDPAIATISAAGSSAPPAATVEEVRVTGTLIRGGSPAAPVLVLDRKALEASGYATVAESLQAIPQNFGGTSTEQTAGGVRADPLHTNNGYSTGVNLRGLGSTSTLILVDGRRLAAAGNKGDFSDVSGIPAIAVQRVEVLLDGASALYGSDAVGGVVNFILRKDLEGGEIRLHAGSGGDGPEEQLVSVGLGHAWRSGSFVLTYEGYHRDALPTSARDFTASSDLRSLGGADHRDTFSYPGNILRTDPATGLSAPFWAIPAGQAGVGLKPTDFLAGVTNLYNQNAGFDLLPDQRRQSVYGAFHQDVSPRIEVSGDARYSYRIAEAVLPGITSTLTVRPANPFFVSPNGATSNSIRYAFGGLGLHPSGRADVASFSTTLGFDAKLFGDWRLSAYGAFAEERTENTQSHTLQSTILSEALANTVDNPGTAYSAARDGFFNPYASVASGNSAATLAAITSGLSAAREKSETSSVNVEADGSVIRLPGGEVRLAVGAQVRKETFALSGFNFNSGVAPTPIRSNTGGRTVGAAFAEFQVPLVGPDNARPGVQRLDLSAAVRAEHYSDFGSTVNPRLGLQWAPVSDVLVRSTYGQSYRAPSPFDLHDQLLNGPIFTNLGTASVLTLARQGGNPGLRPETAKSWTAGIDYTPHEIPDLKVSASWFQTMFRNRIAAPLATATPVTLLVDPRYSPFIQRISPTTNAQDLALITQLLADPATTKQFGTFSPTDFVAIIDERQVNTGGLLVRGIDLLGSYQHDGFGGLFSYAANASWMLDYKLALTPAVSASELVGQIGSPPRFRARLSADWTRGPLTLGAVVNNSSGFGDSVGNQVSGQTTLDLRLRLAGPKDTIWDRSALTLSVRNVFDRAPPFYDNPLGFGYVPGSGDVIGRFISVDLTRSW